MLWVHGGGRDRGSGGSVNVKSPAAAEPGGGVAGKRSIGKGSGEAKEHHEEAEEG